MKSRLSSSAMILAAAFALCASPLGLQADAAKRVLSIKGRVMSKSPTVRMKDIVVNPQSLTESERELEVTEAPTKADETIGIVDLAYMLQKHPGLMDVSIKGPRNIVIQRVADSETVRKAKDDIVSHIKTIPPWKDWEIDVILSPSDESIVSKAAPFAKVEVLPSENKNMIGAVNLNIAFIGEDGRQLSKSSINPTILKKAQVLVMNANSRQGQILSSSDIKRIPMWLGPENRDYVTEESECVGRELAKALPMGEIIKSSDMLRPVCAKRGDIIWIECKSGPLSVKLAVT